jgi:ribonuclease BN (tRNA processing enzyme)
VRLTAGLRGQRPRSTSPASSYLVTAGDTRLLSTWATQLRVLQRHLDPWLLDAVVLSQLHADHCAT